SGVSATASGCCSPAPPTTWSGSGPWLPRTSEGRPPRAPWPSVPVAEAQQEHSNRALGDSQPADPRHLAATDPHFNTLLADDQGAPHEGMDAAGEGVAAGGEPGDAAHLGGLAQPDDAAVEARS